jgi:hypothetical protein
MKRIAGTQKPERIRSNADNVCGSNPSQKVGCYVRFSWELSGLDRWFVVPPTQRSGSLNWLAQKSLELAARKDQRERVKKTLHRESDLAVFFRTTWHVIEPERELA